MKKLILITAILLVLIGCSDKRVEVKDVYLEPTHRMGADDWRTIVEDETGERHKLQGKWGKIGDKFMISWEYVD